MRNFSDNLWKEFFHLSVKALNYEKKLNFFYLGNNPSLIFILE